MSDEGSGENGHGSSHGNSNGGNGRHGGHGNGSNGGDGAGNDGGEAAIRERIDRFMRSFNDDDIEAMLSCLSDDAVYAEIEGKEYRGKAAIRRAFEPEFRGELGKIRFDVTEVAVDAPARKALVRWVCRMDVRGEHGRQVPLGLRLLLRVVYGGRVGFRGVDVLHFNEQARVTAKLAYSKAGRPLLERALGTPL